MKNAILTIALLAFGLSAFAQLPFTFDLGVKAGINSSKITSGNPGGYTYKDFKSDAKTGFNIGAFARLGSKKIYLQPELLYCKRIGQTEFTSSANVPGNQTLDLKTIQIPVLIGFKLINLKLASLRAFTGPAMSFVMTGSSVSSNLQNIDPKNFRNNIWDWQLGAGIDVSKLVIDVRYEWGLTNLSDGGTSTNIGFVNKGNVLTFSLGWKFL